MKPSVSELLRLLDKPTLVKWANEQGLKGIDIEKERPKWFSAGTSIHEQIVNFIKNGDPFINHDLQDKFKEFISDKQILGLENPIETDWFVGRYDIKVKWNDKIYIMDFKNSHGRIYFENKLQLIAYSMGSECDCFGIVSTSEFTVMNFKVEDRTPYEEILKCLSKIYTLKTQLNERF